MKREAGWQGSLHGDEEKRVAGRGVMEESGVQKRAGTMRKMPKLAVGKSREENTFECLLVSSILYAFCYSPI